MVMVCLSAPVFIVSVVSTVRVRTETGDVGVGTRQLHEALRLTLAVEIATPVGQCFASARLQDTWGPMACNVSSNAATIVNSHVSIFTQHFNTALFRALQVIVQVTYRYAWWDGGVSCVRVPTYRLGTDTQVLPEWEVMINGERSIVAT